MASPQIDVAVNVFGKPYQLSLSVLSLLRQSGQNINKIWLQFEPKGSAFDKIPPYCIYEYLKETGLAACEASQPREWLGREPLDLKSMDSPDYRSRIRYQHAFEHSNAHLLFIMHNDVFILKDILSAMASAIGEAFAIGPIGQCWNCPAANNELMLETLGLPACSPGSYQDVRLSREQLCQLYETAESKGIFVRPYGRDGFQGEFTSHPWPLPECRVNEWACLVNMEKVRDLVMPKGVVFPFGGFGSCAGHNLDIGVNWFRDLHRLGLQAQHFDVAPFMKHWVGTGSKTRTRYAHKEDNALLLLRKHFPDYVGWLNKRYPAHLEAMRVHMQ